MDGEADGRTAEDVAGVVGRVEDAAAGVGEGSGEADGRSVS